MIKQMFKIIWNQRRQNGWILAELLLVLVALWSVIDMFVVHTYSYNRPLGYNVENCWQLSFDNYPEMASEYVGDTTRLVPQSEALAIILERLRHAPEVEDACVAFYSSPYSFGNSWQGLMPCGADSTLFSSQSYHRYLVSPEYYKVFRVYAKDGTELSDLARRSYDDIFVTPELEKDFFGDVPAVGRKVRQPGNQQETRIAAVTTSIRENDFLKPTSALYIILSPIDIAEMVRVNGVGQLEVTIRMKKAMTQEEMNTFLTRMGDRLAESNLYVNGVSSWVDQRDRILADNWRMMGIRILLALFILLNVFFGITGTFWLRIEQRRAETGLRMALGSSRRNIGLFFTAEGWLLLAAVILPVLIIIFNMFYLDMPDTYNLPFTWWRFLLGFGGAVFLMCGMITLGTWLPARKAMQLQPAEALHYE